MNNTFNISLNQPFLFFLQFLDRTKKHLLAKLLQSVQHKRNCNTGNNVIMGLLRDGFLCLRNILYSTDDFCLLPPPLDREGRNHYAAAVDNGAVRPLLDNRAWFLIAWG